MPDLDGITRVDLSESDTLEVKVLKTPQGDYKLWVNGPRGMLLRAYNIKHMIIDLDAACLEEAVRERKDNPST